MSARVCSSPSPSSNHWHTLRKFSIINEFTGLPEGFSVVDFTSRKRFIQEMWYTASSATKSIHESRRCRTSFPQTSFLLSEQESKCFLIGIVLTSTTVEYLRLVLLLHKKQLIFQLNAVSVEDNLRRFLGGSLTSSVKRRLSTNFFLHAWCTNIFVWLFGLDASCSCLYKKKTREEYFVA